MNQRTINSETLAAKLTGNESLQLDAEELDATLNWLSGSERTGAGRLIHHLGTPAEQPQLTRDVLQRLDGQLFSEGRLVLDRAFVHTNIDHKERRARFRRLMTAFHPDHHPNDNGWLTPRSQAIHDAWRRFRQGVEEPATEPPLTAARSVVPARGDYAATPDRRSAKLAPELPGLLTRLRLRLQRVDHLQGKAMLLIAVIAFLPVGWIYFAHQPYRQGLDTLSQEVEPSSESMARQFNDRPVSKSAEEPGIVHETLPEETVALEQAVSVREELDLETALALTSPDSAEPALEATAKPTNDFKFTPVEARQTESTGASPAPEHSVREAEETTDADDMEPAQSAELAASHDIQMQQAKDAEESLDTDDEVSLETELRIAQLLGSYRDTFERGQLDGLLGHFSDSPRENRNEGRRWLRQNYQALFENSTRRRLYIDIKEISPHEKGWQADGRFVLQVDYPQRRSMRVDRPVRYMIIEEQEQFRIASIEY